MSSIAMGAITHAPGQSLLGGLAVGGIFAGANAQQNASQNAANAQTAQSQAAISEQQRQFDAVRQLLAPYVNAGTGQNGSLQTQQALLGLLGNDAQQQAINSLSNSARMGSLTPCGRCVLQ